MIITVKEYGKKKKKLDFQGKNIRELLEFLNINPVEVVCVKNGNVVPEDENIDENDIIELFPVVSGGG